MTDGDFPLFEIYLRGAKRSAMIVILTRWADDVLGGTGGSSRGFRTWGSFRPCILRRVQVSPGPFGPGFPRVDSSAT